MSCIQVGLRSLDVIIILKKLHTKLFNLFSTTFVLYAVSETSSVRINANTVLHAALRTDVCVGIERGGRGSKSKRLIKTRNKNCDKPTGWWKRAIAADHSKHSTCVLPAGFSELDRFLIIVIIIRAPLNNNASYYTGKQKKKKSNKTKRNENYVKQSRRPNTGRGGAANSREKPDPLSEVTSPGAWSGLGVNGRRVRSCGPTDCAHSPLLSGGPWLPPAERTVALCGLSNEPFSFPFEYSPVRSVRPRKQNIKNKNNLNEDKFTWIYLDKDKDEKINFYRDKNKAKYVCVMDKNY